MCFTIVNKETSVLPTTLEMKLQSRIKILYTWTPVHLCRLKYYNTMTWSHNLIVLAVGLTLGIQHSRPVVSFEVELGVNIDLDLDGSLGLADRVSGDTNGGESSSDEVSNSGWAPFSNNFSSLQGELGSKNGVLDGSVRIDFSERKGLVDRRALVSKSVDGSTGVDGDADGKSTGNTRGCATRIGKILKINAWNVLKLGLEFGVQGGAGTLREKKTLGDDFDFLHTGTTTVFTYTGLLLSGECSSTGDKRGKDGKLHVQIIVDISEGKKKEAGVVSKLAQGDLERDP